MPIVRAADAGAALLWAQALLDDPARPATPRELDKLISRLGFVQVDTINVVERAHHLTLLSRLDGYQPRLLDSLLERRRLFEHWTHDASLIPIAWYGHWKHRFDRHRARLTTHAWWMQRIGAEPERVLAMVRSRLATDGPLRSRDFEHNWATAAESRSEKGWWGWKPQKAALEHLWRIGELAVAGRENFQKVYDLAERVFPGQHAAPAPDAAAHLDWACTTALDRLGFATSGELAAFWNAISPGQAAQWCRQALHDGRVVKVGIDSLDGSPPRQAIAAPDWRRRLDRAKQAAAAIGERTVLLSPFDPVIRDRRRVQRLFGFDYRFEAFTPAQRRRYGYYVLPILEGSRLVGRLDPKHHRERATLEVRGIWWERGVAADRRRRARLQEALARLAAFIGASRITMPSRRRAASTSEA